jgi:hypothetical protein
MGHIIVITVGRPLDSPLQFFMQEIIKLMQFFLQEVNEIYMQKKIKIQTLHAKERS